MIEKRKILEVKGLLYGKERRQEGKLKKRRYKRKDGR